MACSRCIMLRNDIRVHALTKSLFAFIFNHIHYSENLQLDTLMLLLNREGSFRTEGAPMESCRPAIIVSFGVTAHWLPQKGNREAGIDSVAESCGLMQSGHPQFETLRSVPLKKGDWAMTIFNFRTNSPGRSVSKVARR